MGEIQKGRLGVPAGSALLVTGQTTQYSGKKDDGYYKLGVVKDYTVLTGGQFSGTVDIVLNAKTHVLSNECVWDNNTKKMWARYVPDGDIGPGGDGRLYWIDDVNDEDIFDFVDQANLKRLGGFSDWRVPNVVEMASLINYGTDTPSIDTVAFPSSQPFPHWTGTTHNGLTTYAWNIDFIDGNCVKVEKAVIKSFCRLIRS